MANKSKSKKKTSTKKQAKKTAAETAAVSARNGSAARDFLASNTVPIALVATGVGLMAAKNINGGDNAVTRSAASGKAKVADIAAAAGKKGKSVSRKARDGSGALRNGAGAGLVKAQDTVRTHPVAAGLTAFAIGAGLAMAVPKLAERRKHHG